ncbi:MAG TPA: ABC transporter permease [Ktedonobacterales bacterium]|nr:ABC transporter permease [Ktedonobacterales bacterium]
MAQLSTAPPSSSRRTAQQAPSPPAAQSDTADTASQRGSLLRAFRRLWGFVPALMLGLALLIAWQLLATSGSVPRFLLPAPADVLRAFGQAFASGLLPSYALTTLEESLIGFALGACIAVPLGYAIARSGLIRRTIDPFVAASLAIPAVALAPLLVLWLGYDLKPIAVLCALIIFFPTVVTTELSVRMLDRDVLDAARIDGAGRWALLRYIELPLALPGILAGLRTSLTLSITGAVVGEFVVSDRGLGGLLTIASGQFDSALVFATLLMLALLATTLYLLARLIEWRVSYLEEN